jgi:hypothetical protein
VKIYWGRECISPRIFYLVSRRRCVVGLTSWPLYPQNKSLQYPLVRRLCVNTTRNNCTFKFEFQPILTSLKLSSQFSFSITEFWHKSGNTMAIYSGTKGSIVCISLCRRIHFPMKRLVDQDKFCIARWDEPSLAVSLLGSESRSCYPVSYSEYSALEFSPETGYSD